MWLFLGIREEFRCERRLGPRPTAEPTTTTATDVVVIVAGHDDGDGDGDRRRFALGNAQVNKITNFNGQVMYASFGGPEQAFLEHIKCHPIFFHVFL